MDLTDIVNAIKLQLSEPSAYTTKDNPHLGQASISPESRWIITLLYGTVLFLLLLRFVIGEPIRNLLFGLMPSLHTTSYPGFLMSSGGYYEGDYYVMTNGSLTMRLLALVTTLAMNILPLFLPFLVGSLLNRINTQQNGYQTME